MSRRPDPAATELRRALTAHLPSLPDPAASPSGIAATVQGLWDLCPRVGLTPLLAGPVGSHLFGCAGPGSDLDLFAVVTHTPALGPRGRMHIIAGEVDLRLASLPAFLNEVAFGGHQPAELLFRGPRAPPPPIGHCSARCGSAPTCSSRPHAMRSTPPARVLRSRRPSGNG